MDPFTDAGELFSIRSHFYQGAYREVVETAVSSFSESNAIEAKVYVYRAKIALGDARSVIDEIDDEEEKGPALVAVQAFAYYTLGEKEKGIQQIEKVIEDHSDNSSVEILGGIILQLENRTEEAVKLLENAKKNLEAVAVLVQIRLSQNKLSLAQREIKQAKSWAQDGLAYNLAEAWLDLRLGGDKYQNAYYIFEELAQAPTSSASCLVGQAVAELLLGRIPEAEDALSQAIEKDSSNSNALANAVACSLLSGAATKDTQSYKEKLGNIAPNHRSLKELEQLSSAFDKSSTKYLEKLSTK